MSGAEALRPGAAPGTVLLHGFTQSIASLTELAACAPPTAGQITALALPGHHPSTPVLERGFEGNVDRVAERLRAAVGDGAHLVGYSLGARCALGIAARHPALLSKATLVGVHPGLESDAERAMRVRADRKWIDCLRTEGIEGFVAAWQALPLWGTQREVAPAALALQRAVRLGHEPQALAASLEHMGLGVMPNLRPELARLPIAVELITGALDEKFTQLAQSLEIPHRTVAGCGHNVVLEAPESIWFSVGEQTR